MLTTDQTKKETHKDCFKYTSQIFFFNFRNYTEATDRNPSQLKNGVTPTATHGPIPVSTVWTCLLMKVINSWEIVWLRPLITQKVLLVWINEKNRENVGSRNFGLGIKEQILQVIFCDIDAFFCPIKPKCDIWLSFGFTCLEHQMTKLHIFWENHHNFWLNFQVD